MGSDYKKGLYAGVDVGGTKLYGLITDEDGKVLGRGRKKTKSEAGFDGVMDRVASCLQEACDDAKVKKDDLIAVGIGAPSPILEDGTAVSAVNMGWKDVPLTKTLSKLIGRPVYAENDCNVGTLGEYTYGAGRGCKTLVGLFVGTGLGGGIIFHGEMVRGETRQAAELGHMIVQADGRLCGCGHRGCLEAYASKAGLGRFFSHEIAYLGRKSILSEEPDVVWSNVRSGLLAKAYRAKDPVVVEGLQELARYLGIGVANFITVLGPDKVVLGGGVMEALGNELLDRVRESAKASVHPPAAFKDTRVELAKLEDDAVAIGAMVYARNSHHAEKK